MRLAGKAALISGGARGMGAAEARVFGQEGGRGGRLEDTTAEEWDRVMDINAKGVFLGTKAAIPAMRQAGGGSIINISSQLGLVGMGESRPQYQASKGAGRLLTKPTGAP